MDWSVLYRDWKYEADKLEFKPVTFDNLDIYTKENKCGLCTASFYDKKDKRLLDYRNGWNDTAFKILKNSKDEEKLVAVYIAATIHNIFSDRNDTPIQFQKKEILHYKREVLLTCRDKLGYLPTYNHLCTNVYPLNVEYYNFNCYKEYIWYDKREILFDNSILLYISVLDAMLNSKYAIVYNLNNESLNNIFK